MTYQTKLRKVGGSVMIAIPPVVLDELGLVAGAAMDIAVKSQKLVLEPRSRRRYTLDELLKQARPVKRSKADRAWTAGGPVGRELI
jgi:antitoxin ChpS